MYRNQFVRERRARNKGGKERERGEPKKVGQKKKASMKKKTKEAAPNTPL